MIRVSHYQNVYLVIPWGIQIDFPLRFMRSSMDHIMEVISIHFLYRYSAKKAYLALLFWVEQNMKSTWYHHYRIYLFNFWIFAPTFGFCLSPSCRWYMGQYCGHIFCLDITRTRIFLQRYLYGISIPGPSSSRMLKKCFRKKWHLLEGAVYRDL